METVLIRKSFQNTVAEWSGDAQKLSHVNKSISLCGQSAKPMASL
jgi:hypothetical protein